MKHCITLLAMSVLLSGCIRDGTIVTARIQTQEMARAADQTLLSDAIDQGFSGVDVAKLREALKGAGDLDAYLEVSAPFAMSGATQAYMSHRASLIAGLLGIKVLEKRVVVERASLQRTFDNIETLYPETRARVLLMVSVAGVDDRRTLSQQQGAGSTKPDRILEGRFRATFAVVPRKGAAFVAASQELSGVSSYPIAPGKYLDRRGF
mgnify:CR=1 FL=1